MEANQLVIGHFGTLKSVKDAIEKLQNQERDDFELFSPCPNHELEDLIYTNRKKKRSPVRKFTLLGGLTGCLGAFLMTSWMSLDYPIRTSAKPVLSFPSFVVIAFECTVLLGAIFTLASMFGFARIPNPFGKVGYRPNFSSGTFGLTIRASEDDSKSFKKDFEDSGAEKVEIEYVR